MLPPLRLQTPLLLLLAVAVCPLRAAHPVGSCIEDGTFFYFDFSSKIDPSSCNGILEHSNLGGLGGRCTMPGMEELCITRGAPTASTPHEMLFRGIGRPNDNYLTPEHVMDTVDMRITNISEYRGFNTLTNGIKDGTPNSNATGCFGSINLLAPRTSPFARGQPP